MSPPVSDGTTVVVSGQPVEVGPVFLPCGSSGSNSGCQAWPQSPLPLSHLSAFSLSYLDLDRPGHVGMGPERASGAGSRGEREVDSLLEPGTWGHCLPRAFGFHRDPLSSSPGSWQAWVSAQVTLLFTQAGLRGICAPEGCLPW